MIKVYIICNYYKEKFKFLLVVISVFQSKMLYRTVSSFLRAFNNNIVKSSTIYTSSVLNRRGDRNEMLSSMPVKDEGTIGEKGINIDTLVSE